MTPDDLIGYHAFRLAQEQANPREVAFAEQWKEEHSYLDTTEVLVCFEPDPQSNAALSWVGGMRKVRNITSAERKAVSTIIQWLGSNVGFCFLEMALKRCGYKIVPDEKVGRG